MPFSSHMLEILQWRARRTCETRPTNLYYISFNVSRLAAVTIVYFGKTKAQKMRATLHCHIGPKMERNINFFSSLHSRPFWAALYSERFQNNIDFRAFEVTGKMYGFHELQVFGGFQLTVHWKVVEQLWLKQSLLVSFGKCLFGFTRNTNGHKWHGSQF